MKIQNSPSGNRQKNRLSDMTHHLSILTQHTCNSLAKTCLVWRVKLNFISNKTLNIGTFSRFFFTPYRMRDVKIQNFLSRNNQKNHMTRRLPLLQFARKTSSCLACENEFHSKQKLKQRNTFPFQALAYAL